MNKKNIITLIVFSVFIVYIAFTFYWFKYSKIDDFDKDHLLRNVEFEKIESKIKKELKGDLSNTLIHFRNESCKCNLYSNEHIKKLNKDFKNASFKIKTIDLEKSKLKEIMPAYPSTIIFNNKGDLAYIGAYSDGLMCSEENSIVSIILSNLKKGFNPKYKGIDVKGCYCYIK